MTSKNIFKLLGYIVLCEAVGGVGALVTGPNITSWYAVLARPVLSPPNWIFAPVWTLLYALMGIALYLVLQTPSSARRTHALYLFGVQLILNALWSGIFFGLHLLGIALVEIILMWLAIVATIYFFAKISRTATWLLVPYVLWVSFAAYLNYSLWVLN